MGAQSIARAALGRAVARGAGRAAALHSSSEGHPVGLFLLVMTSLCLCLVGTPQSVLAQAHGSPSGPPERAHVAGDATRGDAQAPSADETTRWARAAARRDFNSGVERFQSGDFRGALRSFRRAYNAFPHPSVLINVAHCYEEMGEPRQAISVYERFLAEAPDAAPRTRQEVQAAIVDLRRRHRIPLEPATEGTTAEPNALAVARPLRPSTDEEAEDNAAGHAAADGSPSGETATQTQASGQGHADGTLATANTLQPEPAPKAATSALDAPTMISGGLTLGMLVAAAVTGVSAVDTNARYDRELEAFQAAPSEATRRKAQATADRARALAWATDVLLVGSAVGAGLSAYFFFTADDDEERLDVVATPETVGVTYSGNF